MREHKKPKLHQVHTTESLRELNNLDDSSFKIIELGTEQRFFYSPQTRHANGGFFNLKDVVGVTNGREFLTVHTVSSGAILSYDIDIDVNHFVDVLDYWHSYCEGLTDD